MKRDLRWSALILALMTVYARLPAQTATFHPGTTMVDDRGKLIQAHGGSILQLGKTFYWFGEEKDGESAKDASFQGVSCYSSDDLQHWHFERNALSRQASGDIGPGRIVERPKVLFNAKTSKYVMWIHVDDAKYVEARAGVAISDKVCGPYKYLSAERPLGYESRDIGLYQDEDGTGYLLTEDRKNGLRIDRLSPDYLKPVEAVAKVEDLEAPALFHAGGQYILLGSFLTGWHTNDNQYWTADNLRGPWSPMHSLAPPGTKTFDSQTTLVVPIRGLQATAYVFLSDRWKPEALGESPYLFLPLNIAHMGDPLVQWHPSWIMNVKDGTWNDAP